MNSSPIIELLITFNYGIPIYSWANPLRKDVATGIDHSEEGKHLISGLLTAILSFSESISSDTVVKQIKMARITYQYAINDNLIFFLGYDSDVSVGHAYEKVIDEFLNELIFIFTTKYRDQLEDSLGIDPTIFDEFSKFLIKNTQSDRWKIEKTQEEVLKEIKELLLEILGPMSEEMILNNIRNQRLKQKMKKLNLELLADDLVYEISLLMDLQQAKQIGEEIHILIKQ